MKNNQEFIDDLKTSLIGVENAAREVYPGRDIAFASEALEAASVPLLIYGIVGGKDVGKTSLMNALVGSEVSQQEFPGFISEGTRRPVIFLHEESEEKFLKWMDEQGFNASEYIVSKHVKQDLSNVVFIDLPDYDSGYPGHIEICNRLVGKLDRLICVSVIGKELDRDMETFLKRADRSEKAWIMILNKYDTIPRPGKNSIEKLRPDLLSGYKAMGLEEINEKDIFILSATNENQFDFPELKERLMRVHADEEIEKHKQEEALRQVALIIKNRRKETGWGEDLDRLNSLLEKVQANLKGLFTPDEISRAERRLKESGGPQRKAAEELLQHKAERFVLLSTLMKPFLPAVAWVGGWVAFRTDVQGEELFDRVFTFRGLGPKARIIDTLYSLTRDAGDLERRFENRFSLFDENSLEKAYSELQKSLERQIRIDLDQFIESSKLPGKIVSISPFFVALWFAILQPILEKMLSNRADQIAKSGEAADITNISLVFVQFLGALFWIKVIGATMLFFLLVVIVLYAHCARATSKRTVSAIREWWLSETTGEILTKQTLAPAFKKRDQLTNLEEKTAELMKKLNV